MPGKTALRGVPIEPSGLNALETQRLPWHGIDLFKVHFNWGTLPLEPPFSGGLNVRKIPFRVFPSIRSMLSLTTLVR